MAHASARQYDKAIADYDVAIRIDPRYVNALAHRGEARRLTGDHAGALADLDQAIAIEPTAGALNERGLVHWTEGRIDAAMADYDAVLRIDPRHVPALSNRGNAKRHKGDIAGAIADYDAALQIRRDAFAARIDRARPGDPRPAHDAQADLEILLRNSPCAWDARLTHGIVLAQRGDRARRAQFRASAAPCPPDARGYVRKRRSQALGE